MSTSAISQLQERLIEAPWLRWARASFPIGAYPHACEELRQACLQQLRPERHGDLLRWFEALQQLPGEQSEQVDLNAAAPGFDGDLTANETARARVWAALQELSPWRKGPFDVFGVRVDAEWRSNLKWDRLANAVRWSGQRVLDVGSGNGYYMLRALGAGARAVLGVDPAILQLMQFHAVIGRTELPALLAPLRFEDLPLACGPFDVVLSLGVLGHRKNPLEHLKRLRQFARAGSRVVVETLVVDGPSGYVLHPEGRYACMRNVYALPSPDTLLGWMRQAGLDDPQVHHLGYTTAEEQRATPWMTWKSLPDFLAPSDPNKTIEGHPAPLRVVVVASV